MIIGINGYAGVGKDTVGEIIKKLQPGEQWEIKKFAGKLKTIASILTNIPVENFEDQQFKKLELDPMWSDHGIPMTVRDFLQKLGTDGLRNGLHPNTWVNALMADYTAQPNKAVADFLAAEGLPASMNAGEKEYPNWIITDCRFPNEARAIKNAGGVIVRVNRDGYRAINAHPSEVALDKWSYDYVIDNDGSVEDLKKNVKELLKKIYEITPH